MRFIKYRLHSRWEIASHQSNLHYEIEWRENFSCFKRQSCKKKKEKKPWEQYLRLLERCYKRRNLRQRYLYTLWISDPKALRHTKGVAAHEKSLSVQDDSVDFSHGAVVTIRLAVGTCINHFAYNYKFNISWVSCNTFRSLIQRDKYNFDEDYKHCCYACMPDIIFLSLPHA